MQAQHHLQQKKKKKVKNQRAVFVNFVCYRKFQLKKDKFFYLNHNLFSAQIILCISDSLLFRYLFMFLLL